MLMQPMMLLTSLAARTHYCLVCLAFVLFLNRSTTSFFFFPKSHFSASHPQLMLLQGAPSMQKRGFVFVFAELHEITGGLFPQPALFTVDCSYAFLHISWGCHLNLVQSGNSMSECSAVSRKILKHYRSQRRAQWDAALRALLNSPPLSSHPQIQPCYEKRYAGCLNKLGLSLINLC